MMNQYFPLQHLTIFMYLNDPLRQKREYFERGICRSTQFFCIATFGFINHNQNILDRINL